jgi:hypothetical protein
VLAELRNLQKYREKEVGAAAQILALGLSSRKNMCIHPQVAEEGSRESVDAKCRKLTASWVRWGMGGGRRVRAVQDTREGFWSSLALVKCAWLRRMNAVAMHTLAGERAGGHGGGGRQAAAVRVLRNVRGRQSWPHTVCAMCLDGLATATSSAYGSSCRWLQRSSSCDRSIHGSPQTTAGCGASFSTPRAVRRA